MIILEGYYYDHKLEYHTHVSYGEMTLFLKVWQGLNVGSGNRGASMNKHFLDMYHEVTPYFGIYLTNVPFMSGMDSGKVSYTENIREFEPGTWLEYSKYQ